MAFDPDAYLASQPATNPTDSGGGFDPDAYLASKTPSYGQTLKTLLQNPKFALNALGEATSRTPTSRIQSGLDTAGQAIAEKGGQMGIPGSIAGTAGGIVSNAPALLGAATSAGPILGKWAGELADTVPGQFVGRALSNEVGAVGGTPPSPTPPSGDLPIMQSGSKTGDPHALFAYNDNFGPGGSPRSLYNVYGDPNHPSIQQIGWGSSVPKDVLDKAGIPIVGQQAGASAYKPLDLASTAAASQPSASQQPIPNYFEQKGGANLNYAAGIRGRTIEAMTPSGQNPGTVGINLAKRLQDEGAMGTTPIETFQKANDVANQYGQGVGNAYKAIDQANQTLGGAEGDALKIDANSSLKPILDEANKLRDLKNYPEQIKVGRYLYITYSRLSDAANANDGMLTLDDVHRELQQVGNLYSPTNENIIDPVYSRLIKLQNDMVSEVADRASNPSLSENLLKQNEGYSTYMRIMPDIRRAAANMAAGQQSMSSFMGDIRGALTGEGPLGGRMALGIGKGLSTAGQASPGGLTLPRQYAGSILSRKEQP